MRIPRLMGLTALLADYHKSGETLKEEKYKQIIAYVTNQWALNNGLICGISYNPASLSAYLGCDIEDIYQLMMNRLLNNRLWDKNKQEQILNSITGMSISMAIEDRMEAAAQVEILKRSQGNNYVPFISAELRQTMDLKMKAGAQLSSMIKNIMGGTTNIFNINQENNNGDVQTNNYISKEDALQIINEETANDTNKLSLGEKSALYLEEHYDMSDLPEVTAKGVLDAGKEGLAITENKQKLLQITDNYKMHREEPTDVDFHEIRRGLELGIDEEDDPELDTYE